MCAPWLALCSLLVSALPVAAQGGLGALCDERSPCQEGLTCRDGFCLRVPGKAEPEKAEPEKVEPEKVEPEKAEPEKAEPEKVEREKAEPEKAEPEKAEPEKAEPEKAEPEKAEPEKAEPEKAEPSGVPPIGGALTPAPAERALTPAAVKELAEDASGGVWGSAVGRALAVPALACGAGLFCPGVVIALGSRAFADASERAEFPSVEDNAEALLGANIVGAGALLMAAAGVPCLVVGEGAVLYSAFADWTPCSSGFTLEDSALTTLALARAAVWFVGAQVGALGVGIVAAGVWALVISDVGRGFGFEDPANALFRDIGNQGSVAAPVGVIPLGLGCVLGLLAVGLDLGTILRAGALEEATGPDDVAGANAVPRREATPLWAAAPTHDIGAPAAMSY